MGQRLRRFDDFVKDSINNADKRTTISLKAQRLWEDPVDINSDVKILTNFTGVMSLTTYRKALIHSQLFEAPFGRRNYHLYTLAEFASLRKHTNSFVCFHDEGLY